MTERSNCPGPLASRRRERSNLGRRTRMRTVLFLTAALLLCSQSALADDAAASHVIENVKYVPMLDSYCATTGLQMILDYCGAEADKSLLLNLGWDYGFFFLSTPFYSMAYPCTEPIAEVAHAARLLGFQTEVLTHTSLEQARAALVKHLRQDRPVLIQWTPHTVLAFGYEDGGDTIIIHDPGEPRAKLAGKAAAFPFARGPAVKCKISDWVKPPYLWNYRQFQMAVVQPGDKKRSIDWKRIWKRNAQKTLGTDADAYGAFSGVKGIRSLAAAFKNRFARDEKGFREVLKNFQWTFPIGVGFRRNASAFLAGQAAAMNNPHLARASRCFRQSAYLFKEGESLMRHLQKHPEKQAELVKAIVAVLLDIAKVEERAAGFLLKAAGSESATQRAPKSVQMRNRPAGGLEAMRTNAKAPRSIRPRASFATRQDEAGRAG